MALRLFSRKRSKVDAGKKDAAFPSDPDFNPARSEFKDSDPLLRMIRQGRAAAILRDLGAWESHADAEEIRRACENELEQRMAFVPAGNITLAATLSAALGSPEQETLVEPFLLDVYAVTNARFQQFVDGGGYDALEYWPEEIWPHLIEFKDITAEPGPRFWKAGRHDDALADHPVVGVSWYETQAYALWIGQRLPSEPEWEMAASWHIRSSTDCIRRFPWGDAMDASRCNVWSSRRGTTVPVSDYANGAAPNQVRQLVGNVWEWTDSEFSLTDDNGGPIVGEMPMRALRGGAFNTYFDAQATSVFRSGQVVLARPDNVGFRCAMDIADATWMNVEDRRGAG